MKHERRSFISNYATFLSSSIVRSEFIHFIQLNLVTVVDNSLFLVPWLGEWESAMDPRLSSTRGFHRSRPIYAHLTAIHGRRAWSTSSPPPPRAKVRAAESRVPGPGLLPLLLLLSSWEKIFMGALNGNDDFTRESHQLHGVTRYVVLLITSHHFINI